MVGVCLLHSMRCLSRHLITKLQISSVQVGACITYPTRYSATGKAVIWSSKDTVHPPPERINRNIKHIVVVGEKQQPNPNKFHLKSKIKEVRVSAYAKPSPLHSWEPSSQLFACFEEAVPAEYSPYNCN